MAVLKSKDAKKMSLKERADKLKELRFELVRASVATQKATSKTKEIKRAISRLYTFSASHKTETKDALKKK